MEEQGLALFRHRFPVQLRAILFRHLRRATLAEVQRRRPRQRLERWLILFERGQLWAIIVLVDLLFQPSARFAPIFRPTALIDSVTLRKRLPRRDPLFFVRWLISVCISQEKIMPA